MARPPNPKQLKAEQVADRETSHYARLMAISTVYGVATWPKKRKSGMWRIAASTSLTNLGHLLRYRARACDQSLRPLADCQIRKVYSVR